MQRDVIRVESARGVLAEKGRSLASVSPCHLYSKKDRIAAIVTFLLVFAVFRLSPVYTIYDSAYEMLFSQQLLWNHTFSLEPGRLPDSKSGNRSQFHESIGDLPYQVMRAGERLHYVYPPGGVVLSMPGVAVANAMGISAVDQNGIHDPAGEAQIQAYLAPLLMAVLAVIVFNTARLMLSFNWSLLITAATAFGTQIWSTASRAMWGHTWGILILAFVVWLIVRTETKQATLRPVLLATCLSWLYFVRPTFCSSIVPIALYVLICHRTTFLPFVMTGCTWLAAFIGYSEHYFRRIVPPYFQANRLGFTNAFWEALLANLISPSRGVLIYVPVLAFVIYLLVRYRKASRSRLVALAVSVVLVHLIIISLFLLWPAGHSYGPRYTTDVVPWFSLLAMIAVEARLKWRASNAGNDSLLRVRIESGVAALLLLCSIALNGIGAISVDAWRWNLLPSNIDEDPNRVWDWKHPQFLGVPRYSSAWGQDLAA